MANNSNLENVKQSSNTNQFSHADLKKYKNKIENKEEIRNKEIKRFLSADLDDLSEVDKKKIIALLSKKNDYSKSAVSYNLLMCRIAQSHNESLKTKALLFAKKNGIEALLKASVDAEA